MTTSLVYSQGRARVVIPATESIAIYSPSDVSVYRELGYPNEPSKLSLLAQQVAGAGASTYGAYADGAVIVIEAGAAEVFYEVGVAPAVQWPLRLARPQGNPVAVNTTGAVSAAAMLGGIVTSTTAAAVDGTVPTGAVLAAASQFAVGDSFDWSVINTGANAFTVTAADSHTLVGAAAVATVTSGHFRTRCTAAGVFVTYRMG